MFALKTPSVQKITDLASRLVNMLRPARLKARAPDLQEKTRLVLQYLKEKSPQVVSREEIIESVWNGQFFTGEKGLNQAIWNLRKTLGDDARAPTFIRTVPREGYQWIHAAPFGHARHTMRMSVLALIVLGLVMLTSGSTVPLAGSPTTAINSSEGQDKGVAELPMVAATAILEDNNIVVDFQSGCRGIILPSDGKVFGQPVISENGIYVAFTVHKEATCKTVMFNVDDQSRQEFDYCPAADVVHT